MSRKTHWTTLLGEAISLTAAFVLIAVSLLTFNIGLTAANQDEPEPDTKKPYVEEELNIPDPCAGANDGWAFVSNEEIEPGEKDCGSESAPAPAKEVAPADPCGSYVFAHNTDEPYLENDICAVTNRDI